MHYHIFFISDFGPRQELHHQNHIFLLFFFIYIFRIIQISKFGLSSICRNGYPIRKGYRSISILLYDARKIYIYIIRKFHSNIVI